MRLEEIARTATMEVVDLVAPSSPTRLAELKETRRRRTATTLVAAAAAVAGIGAGVLVLGPLPQPEPTTPGGKIANGALVTVHNRLQAVAGGALTSPDDIAPLSTLAFTEDGAELVYQTRGYDEIVAMDVATGETRVLIECRWDYCEGVLSPDGTRLALIGGREGVEVWDLTRDDMGYVQVDGMARDGVAWSPDGRQLGAAGSEGLHVISLAGPRAVIHEIPAGTQLQNVRWSPSGDRIAFYEVITDESGVSSYTARLISADGTGLVTLVDAGTCSCEGLAPPALVWAPDGSQLLVGTTDAGSRAFTPDGDAHPSPVTTAPLRGRAAWQPVPAS